MNHSYLYSVRAFSIISIIVLLVSSCASLRYEDHVEIFLTANHKSAPKSNDARINIFQFVDNDRNAYVTRWAAKSHRAKAFSATKLDCLDAQAETLTAKKLTPVSQLDVTSFAPVNYKALVKCVFDNGYKLVGRDSFLPDMFTLTFARKHLSEGQSYAASGKGYLVKKSGASYSEAFAAVTSCNEQAIGDHGSGGENKDWEEDYARPYKESLINCLVALEYRVWQN